MGNTSNNLPTIGRSVRIDPDGNELSLNVTESSDGQGRVLQVHRGAHRLQATTSFLRGSLYWENGEAYMAVEMGFKPLVEMFRPGTPLGDFMPNLGGRSFYETMNHFLGPKKKILTELETARVRINSKLVPLDQIRRDRKLAKLLRSGDLVGELTLKMDRLGFAPKKETPYSLIWTLTEVSIDVAEYEN
jgi:hypothetical protein